MLPLCLIMQTWNTGLGVTGQEEEVDGGSIGTGLPPLLIKMDFGPR